MPKKKSSTLEDVKTRREGDILLKDEHRLILEKYLSTQPQLREVVYEARKLETVRIILEPNKKLVVVKRELNHCRLLLTAAKVKLGKRHLNRAFVLNERGEKIRIFNTRNLLDDTHVWFDFEECLGRNEEFEEEEKVLESEPDDEEEFELPPSECFTKATTSRPRVVIPLLPLSPQHVDFARNNRLRVVLPIDDHEVELVRAIQNHHVTVVQAPTGSGKSTRLVQYLLEADPTCNIVVTEPRRIAAVTLAARVCQELGEYGEHVCGYSVRTETKVQASTNRILFCTVGVLLRRLAHDAQLQGCTHVLVDEAHEQDVLTELLLIFLADLLTSSRPDLKLVILSATLDTGSFRRYFSPPLLCCEVCLPGSMFPVTTYFLDDLKTKFLGESPKPQHVIISECLMYFIHTNKPESLVALVFVSGSREIQQAISQLKRDWKDTDSVEFLPLHAGLSNQEQKRCFAPSSCRFRIVVATNVAETSVTIPFVGLVLDCGMYKESSYCPETRTQKLTRVMISQSAMLQRRGRAGRMMQGTCFHLFSQAHELLPHAVPGMQKDSLENAMVLLKGAKQKVNAFQFFAKALHPPSLETVYCTLQDLLQLGVLAGTCSRDGRFDNTELTPLGFHVARLGTSSRVGKLLIFGCLFNCAQSVLTIASVLDGKNPFALKPNMRNQVRQLFGEDDFSAYVKAQEIYRSRHVLASKNSSHLALLNFSACELNEKIRLDFERDLKSAGFLTIGTRSDEANESWPMIRACMAAGLFPNVGKVFPDCTIFSTGQVELEKSCWDSASTVSTVARGAYFVFHESIRLENARTLSLRKICEVPVLSLLLFAGNLSRSRKESVKLKCVTFRLCRCWLFRCRNRDAMLLLQLRYAMDEALLDIYLKGEDKNANYHKLFTMTKQLFLE